MTSRRFTLEDLQRKGFNVAGNKAVKENKIRNAEKGVTSGGVKTASKLELYLYNLLTAVKIPFVFQYEIVLQEGFRFHGTFIRPIKIIIDFHLTDHDILADSKGWQLADNKIKHKMLKRKLVSEGKNTTIELPSTKEECEALINKLLKLKS